MSYHFQAKAVTFIIFSTKRQPIGIIFGILAFKTVFYDAGEVKRCLDVVNGPDLPVK